MKIDTAEEMYGVVTGEIIMYALVVFLSLICFLVDAWKFSNYIILIAGCLLIVFHYYKVKKEFGVLGRENEKKV